MSNATLRHQDQRFERKTLHVTGHFYANCIFQNCTLIVSEMPLAAAFENCQFDSCVWQLSLNVRDRRVWQNFLEQVGPAILHSLPVESNRAANRAER